METSERSLGITLILPVFFLMAFIFYYPTSFAFYISFHEWGYAGTPVFVGVENYAKLLLDPLTHKSTLITFYFVIVSVSFSLLIGLGMALVLNEEFRMRGALRGIWLMPWVMAPVAVGAMWNWIYHRSYGALNSVLMQVGFSGVGWLADPFTALNSVIFVDIWQWAPFMMIVTLAGLQAISPDLYKAARIDGANAWNRFRHITLPSLVPIISIAVLIKTAFSFRTFDIIYILTRGGPALGTKVLNYYAYENIFKYNVVGEGSAIAFVTTMLSLMVIGGYFYALRRRRRIG